MIFNLQKVFIASPGRLYPENITNAALFFFATLIIYSTKELAGCQESKYRN